MQAKKIEASYRSLGLMPGASQKEIKTAYRKLAFKYHPDRNPDPSAVLIFSEITDAYEFLTEPDIEQGIDVYANEMAAEIIRKEREELYRRAKERRKQKKEQEDYFKRPEWHDPILFFKYLGHYLVLFIASACIIIPVYLAIRIDPVSLAGTFFFVLAGVVLLIYIFQKRKTWFRPGTFNKSLAEMLRDQKITADPTSNDFCCYSKGRKAGAKPYRIEVLNVLDIEVRTFGLLNHATRYKKRTRKVILPRSIRARVFHRYASWLRISSLFLCLFLLPLDSVVWRFFGGLFVGGVLSALFLLAGQIRSKTAFLFTPGLLVKIGIWLLAFSLISHFGPGFEVYTSEMVGILIFLLLFLQDMLVDLILGLFPFYKRLFRPVSSQGQVLDELYREGYQNNLEFPVYSVLFPMIKWLF